MPAKAGSVTPRISLPGWRTSTSRTPTRAVSGAGCSRRTRYSKSRCVARAEVPAVVVRAASLPPACRCSRPMPKASRAVRRPGRGRAPPDGRSRTSAPRTRGTECWLEPPGTDETGVGDVAVVGDGRRELGGELCRVGLDELVGDGEATCSRARAPTPTGPPPVAARRGPSTSIDGRGRSAWARTSSNSTSSSSTTSAIHGRSRRPVAIGGRGRVPPGQVLVVELDVREVVRLGSVIQSRGSVRTDARGSMPITSPGP